MTELKVSIIVAMDDKRGIGKNNRLPWHIPEDLKRFKKLTSGHTIIMGRKTFESILSYTGKPLPDRINMVITRNPDFKAEGVSINTSLEEALSEAKENEQSEIFIIGGAQIFQQAIDMGVVDIIYLTKVQGDYGADTFFPDYSQFRKVISEEEGESKGIKYKFVDLERGE
ncbi:MAG: dihydrofolate reductase [Patescibacteria group bacterium]